MAALKRCELTTPHKVHAHGDGPPFYHCAGIPSRPEGPLARSAREHLGQSTFVLHQPKGLHALLCRLGVHSWERRVRYVYHRPTQGWTPWRCRVCGATRGISA